MTYGILWMQYQCVICISTVTWKYSSATKEGCETMKKRTYNNMIKATKLIAAKGYSWQEANEIAIKIFDQAEINNNGMSIEWYIEKVRDAE